MTAVLFALPHYFGFPPGVAGVLVGLFLGWLLAKSMLETRGFLWPWLLQFSLDFWAMFMLAMSL